MFVCIGGVGCALEAGSPLASQICFDWCVYSCCIAWARKGRGKTTKFRLFFLLSFVPSPILSSERWLGANQLYNQGLHWHVIDRCYFLPWLGEHGLFFKPLGKIGLHGRAMYASELFVNVGFQLQTGRAAPLSPFRWEGNRRIKCNGCKSRLKKIEPPFFSNFSERHLDQSFPGVPGMCTLDSLFASPLEDDTFLRVQIVDVTSALYQGHFGKLQRRALHV